MPSLVSCLYGVFALGTVLRGAVVQDDGVEAVAEALGGTAPSLRELDFSGNEVTADGAAAVAACIKRKPHLEYLALEENEIGSAGAKQVIGMANAASPVSPNPLTCLRAPRFRHRSWIHG